MPAAADGIDPQALEPTAGPVDDVAGPARRLLSGDEDAARLAMSELEQRLHADGRVHPAAAEAVPMLVDVVRSATEQRVPAAWLLGTLADPHRSRGPGFARVRAAVTGHVGALTPLLGDADPFLRSAVAYALAQGGADPAPLRARWAVEDDDEVRASLLLALGVRDPAGSGARWAAAVAGTAPGVGLAAAVALHRAGTPWPDGTVAVVVDALTQGAELEYCWQRDLLRAAEAEELVGEVDDDTADALLTGLVASPNPEARQAGLWGLVARCRRLRSAPDRLLPLLVPLIDDPDAWTRLEAGRAFRHTFGSATARYADDLARVAARYADGITRAAAEHPVQGRDRLRALVSTPGSWAVQLLAELGDTRWLDPLCTVEAAGLHNRPTYPRPGRVPFDPVLLEAIRRRLATLVEQRTAESVIGLLADLLGGWGTRAADAVPELVAVLPYAGGPVARALLRIGHRDPAMVAPLRALAGRDGDVTAAVAVWHLSADPQPLIGVLRRLLDRPLPAPFRGAPPSVPPGAEAAVTEAGGALEPLVGAAAEFLTGTAAGSPPDRAQQVLAARLVATCTGDVPAVLPTLAAVLRAGGVPAARAADLVGDLAADERTEVLKPRLRDLLGDRRAQVAAACALHRLSEPPTSLTASLLAAIEHGEGPDPADDADGADERSAEARRRALELLVTMRAGQAAPELDRLAERDERIAMPAAADVVWSDEALQAQLRWAVRQLRAG